MQHEATLYGCFLVIIFKTQDRYVPLLLVILWPVHLEGLDVGLGLKVSHVSFSWRLGECWEQMRGLRQDAVNTSF